MFGLGNPTLPECRSGLTLFLRKGMWIWGQGFNQEGKELELKKRVVLKTQKAQMALVKIFATIVMNVNQA